MRDTRAHRNWTWRATHRPEMPLSLECIFACGTNRSHKLLCRRSVRLERRLTANLMARLPSLSGVDQLAYMTLHILRNSSYEPGSSTMFVNWQSSLTTMPMTMRSGIAEQDSFIENAINSGNRVLLRARMVQLPSSSYGSARDRYTSRESRSWLDCFCGSALESMFRLNKDLCGCN